MDIDVHPHAGIGLAFLFGRVITPVVEPSEPWLVVGKHVELHTLLAHQRFVDRRVIAGEMRVPVAIMVIDRHMPLGNGHAAAHWDNDCVGEQQVGHPYMIAGVVEMPPGFDLKSEIGSFHINGWRREIPHDPGHGDVFVPGAASKLPPVGIVRVLVLKVAMQERGMRGVDPNLDSLQVVALEKALEGKHMAVGCLEAIDSRQRRRITGPEIGENHAIAFDAGVIGLAEMADAVVFGKFPGLIQAGAVRREKPAMEGTAKSVFLETPVTQVDLPVGTVSVNQADLAAAVPKQHQILSEDAHRNNWTVSGKFIGQCNRLPVEPHQATASGSLICFGQLSVDLVFKHVIFNLVFKR